MKGLSQHITLLATALLAFCLNLHAQSGKNVFKGRFVNAENDIRITIDLYDTTVVAPGYTFLGKTNGYMTGKLYDAWFVTRVKFDKKNNAIVTFSNDLGADTQDITFRFDAKGQLLYEANGENVIRRRQDNKWVKLPKKLVFTRQGK